MIQEVKQPEDEIGVVQGRIPASKNEWFVAQALDRLNLSYIYQYGINGGSGIRGGVVLDFLVTIPPSPYAVFVGAGGYWHSKKQENEDRIDHAVAEHYFGVGFVVDLTEEETNTKDKAFTAVKKVFL